MENFHDKKTQTTNYEEKVELRAVKHREISHRSNTTTCRSPTRDLDTSWIKSELQRKRQLEFSKQRLLDNGALQLLSSVPRRKFSKLHSPERVTQILASIRRPLIKLQREQKDEDDSGLNARPVWYPRLQEKGKNKRVLLPEVSFAQKTVTASIQTESGLIIVKEADVHQLADYLTEALYREAVLKKKLSDLQKRAATLLHSTELLWKTRCNEDLLKSKIRALEAQLQVCIKGLPQGGIKKVVHKMEKQQEVYEQKFLKVIMKAESEKAEALSKLEQIQGALEHNQSESERWKSLFEEQKDGWSQLKKQHDECTDQILQLQGQVECSVRQEEKLRYQTDSLQKERAELISIIAELNEENLSVREYLQELIGHKEDWFSRNREQDECEDPPERDHIQQTDVTKQLRDAEHKLRVKENECKALQQDLQTLEQECHAYQSRLRQCKEELTTRNTRRRCCGSFLWTLLILSLLMVVVVGSLWSYHLPSRDNLCQLYYFMKHRMEELLGSEETPRQSQGFIRPM